MEWHAIGSRQILKLLDTGEDGLSLAEAARRLQKNGPNSITVKKTISPLSIFINQFKSMLVILLILAALISLGISILSPKDADIFDAILIFAIVLANASFGFFQEFKAEKSIEALTRMSAPKATVLRGGIERDIPSHEVVAGDILLLNEGDKVAADSRVLSSFSLYSDESSLTGESVPISKKDATLKESTPLAERHNMVYMNSVISQGRGTAVVVQTGLSSEIGRIAKEISEAPEKTTQFQIEIEDIGKKVSFITLAMLVIISISEFLMHTGDILFIFIAAVALGVAAIPEGLPAVVTLALSMATSRMLKQNALTRRLSTIQDLGSVDVICTDKTGTLTENAMTVTDIYIPDRHISVAGKGHDIDPGINPLLKDKDLAMILRSANLCNNSRLVMEDGRSYFKGDPTEIALLVTSYKAGVDVHQERSDYKRVHEIVFSAERKMMSTVNQRGKSRFSFVKGASEVIMRRCTHILDNGKVRRITKEDNERVHRHGKSMASKALRVLGFAYKEDPDAGSEEDAENGLIFLGLMGMIDPPRPGVREAVEDCRRAGIRVVMISGDNRYTAEAVGRELGFQGKAVTGDELDSMDESAIQKTVTECDIFARASPKHKVLILGALKASGHVVCMSGDGVNDAAAIKRSDVGISMGIRGTEVTKQASDMIILDDNFITIRNAISEGRGTFDNIRKFVVYLIGANVSEVMLIFFVTIASLPISSKIPVQLLWINLVTDGLPALALGVDPSSKDIMERKPRKKSERIVDMRTIFLIGALGISSTAALLAIYFTALGSGTPERAQTVLFCGIVFFELLSVLIVRRKYNTPILSNPYLYLAIAISVILQIALLYTPLNAFFGVIPLEAGDFLLIGAGILLFLALFGTSLLSERFIFKKEKG